MKGLTEEARKRNETPPKFVLYVNLIPNWERKDNSYDNEDYLKVKTQFMERVNKEFAIDNLEVVDFYSLKDVSEDEKKYLDKLKSGGSNPDLMKTHAIVTNKKNKHLQIDTNTKIASFRDLYDLTFGQEDNKQYDRLNACVYSDQFISAHNKIVYTYPDSPLATALSKNYPDFCKKHGENPEHKQEKANRIYGQLFNTSLQECGLTITGSLSNRSKVYYPANLEKKEEYRLTKAIATAVNRSWDTSYKDEELKKLKQIEPVKVGDAKIDFMTYAYLIKKHTNIFSEHASSASEGNTYKSINNTLRLLTGFSLSSMLSGSIPEDGEIRSAFHALSNSEYEYKAMAEFYNHVLNKHPELIEDVARVIPQTARGNELSQALFGCTVRALLQNPKQQANAEAKKVSPIVDKQSKEQSSKLPLNQDEEHRKDSHRATKDQSDEKIDYKKEIYAIKRDSEDNLDDKKSMTLKK
ncbi:hypothetical protein [Legionella londiniensis]